MNSYQKLKEKIKELEDANLALKQDLYSVVMEPGSLKAIKTRTYTRMEAKVEKALMFGGSPIQGNTPARFCGLIDQIKNTAL